MRLTGVTVLVVEDDDDTRELLTLILSRCGATVCAAASARDAITACDAEVFDVVVSDLSMPEADGYALLRALKLRRSYIHIPAIAVTGFANHRAQALEAGFDLFLVKPVEPKILCRCVEAVVASER